MHIKAFWLDWDTDDLETRAIKSIYQAIDFLFENVDEKDVLAIYVKGSFVRREILPKSDVDIVPIVRDNDVVAILRKLQDEKGSMYAPSELRSLSLPELQVGKRSNGEPGNPVDLLERRDKCELIWGKEITGIPLRGLETRCSGYEKAFPDHFFPNFEKGIYSQKDLAKAAFWLIDTRFRAQGITPPLRFADMIGELPKKHFGHLAWDVRMGKNVPDFYTKFKEYWEKKEL